MKPNALTRAAINRCARLHPDWTPDQVYESVRRLVDAAGPYPDNLTLEDVKDAIYSMPGCAPKVLV